jgi:uncharacterized membrane protein
MDLHAILLEIEQHGLPLVMLVMIIVVWFIPWVRSMQGSSNRASSPTDLETEQFEKSVIYDMEITQAITDILEEFGAQWAVLWQFHNGVISTAGVPFMKMSVTHEATAPDFEPRGAPYINIPISIFSDALQALQKTPILYVTLEGKYASIANIYRREKVHHGYYIRILNEKERLIAALSLTYAKPHKISEEDYSKVNGYANRISILLAKLAVSYPKKQRSTDRKS